MYLCVPITSGHDVYGVLYLDRLLEGRPFQEQVIEELAPLMALVSLKIENVHLVEEQLQDQLTRAIGDRSVSPAEVSSGK